MYMKDFYVNTLQRCSRNFRESSLPRKLFFAITVVQLTLLLFVSVYYTYRLQAKNNVHRTDWRYALSGKPRAVSGINTKTSLLHSQPSSQDENVYSLAKSMKANISIPKCPLVPPYLTGKYNIDKTEYDEKTLKRKLYFVQDGGAYKPSTCKPRHKVAIVIPYRNRKQHLRILLYNLHPFLQRQQLEYQIFVVELAPQIDFNRALCMNIGFLEARKRGYKCFIFHDVDLIPENDNNVYSCPENPRHMSVAIDKFGYELPYVGLFGGVTAMSEDQFTLVNGYSNKFFGWGGEDDDLYRRIRNLGISITRYTPDVSSYRMLKHVADSNLNNNRQRLLEGALSRWKEDGLNTIKYESLQVQRRPLYTYVLANINQDEWMYQPWTSASDKSSDSIDPALEEIVIDKAKYLLGKYTLDDDIITAITKEFRSLNSSSVSMKVVSGILTRLFPMKSAEPVVLPLVVQSSENESITNNQTRLVERDAPTLEVIPRGIQEPHEQAHNQTYSNQQTPPSQKRYPIQKEYRMENQTKEHSNRQDIWNFMSQQKIKKANPAWKRHVKHGSNPFLENQPKEEKLKSAQNELVMQNFGMNGHKQKIQTLIDTLRAKNMKIAGVNEKSSKHTQFNRNHVLPILVQQNDAEAHSDTKIKTEQDKQTLTQNEQDKQTHTQDKTEQDKQTLTQHEPEQDKQILTQNEQDKQTLTQNETEQHQQTLTQHEPKQYIKQTLTLHEPEQAIKQTLTQHEPEQDKQTLTQHETEQDKQTLTQHKTEQDKQTLTQHETEQDQQTLTHHKTEQDKQTLTQHEPKQDKQTLIQHEPEQDKQTLTQHEPEQDKQTLTQHEPEQDKQTLTQHKTEQDKQTLTQHKSEQYQQTLTQHEPEQDKQTLTQHETEQDKQTLTQHEPKQDIKQTLTLHEPEQDKQTLTQHEPEQDKQTLTQHEPEQDKQTLTQHEPEQDKQTLTQHKTEQDKQTLTQHEPEQDKQTLTQHEPEQDKQTLTQHEPKQDIKQTHTQHEPEQDKQTLTQHEPEQDKQTLTQHEPEQDKQTLTQHEPKQDIKQTHTQHEPEQDKQTLTQHESEQDKQTLTQHESEQDKQTLTQHEPEQDKQTLTQHEPEQDKQTLTQHEPEQDKQTLTQHEPEQDKQTLTHHKTEQDKQTLTQHEPEQDKQTLTQHEPEQDKQTLTQHEPEQDKQTLIHHKTEQDKKSLIKHDLTHYAQEPYAKHQKSLNRQKRFKDFIQNVHKMQAVHGRKFPQMVRKQRDASQR